MAVDAIFAMHTFGGPTLTETQIDEQIETRREGLRSNRDYGAIHIRAEGQPDVTIDDEMWALVLNLCFRPIQDLLAGRAVEVPYFRYSGGVALRPNGSEVLIAGDDVPEARYPLLDLLQALYACGRRYMQYRRRLCGDDPDSEAVLATLAAAADEAGRALEMHGERRTANRPPQPVAE